MLVRMLIYMIPFAVIGWMSYSTRDLKSPTQSYSDERYAKPNEGRIRAALLDVLQNPDPVCVPTPRLPFDSSLTAATCDKCDALADAGLLEKSVARVTVGDRDVVAVRYELTPAGRPLYTEAVSAGSGSGRRAALCFGTTVIGELELWTPGTRAFPVVDVRYVARIETPHEILYGPHARALGLPQLEKGSDTLPKAYLCAPIDNQGVFSGPLDGPQLTVNGVPRCTL